MIIASGMTENHQKEALSRAYIHAIAAKAGANVNVNTYDYGIDVEFNEIKNIDGERLETGSTFKCQLKATKNWSMNGDEVVYTLKAETYNRLVKIRNHATLPLVLILLCLPPNQDEWHEMCEEFLKIRRCCYWLHWDYGLETTNTSGINIHFPRSQIFTPEALVMLFQQFRRGTYR